MHQVPVKFLPALNSGTTLEGSVAILAEIAILVVIVDLVEIVEIVGASRTMVVEVGEALVETVEALEEVEVALGLEVSPTTVLLV